MRYERCRKVQYTTYMIKILGIIIIEHDVLLALWENKKKSLEIKIWTDILFVCIWKFYFTHAWVLNVHFLPLLAVRSHFHANIKCLNVDLLRMKFKFNGHFSKCFKSKFEENTFNKKCLIRHATVGQNDLWWPYNFFSSKIAKNIIFFCF